MILEWTASSTVVIGNYLAANSLPHYKEVFILANILWIIVGRLWKKPSVVFMSSAMLVMYLWGYYAV